MCCAPWTTIVQYAMSKITGRSLILCLLLLSPGFVFADTRIESLDKTALLDDFFMIESDIDEGRHILTDRAASHTEAYDGGPLELRDHESYMLTFRTDFALDAGLEGTEIAFLMDPTSYPYNVYLNGAKLYSIGQYRNAYHPFTYDAEEIQIPADMLRFGDQANQLAIEIFPRYQTIALFKITVAESLQAHSAVFWRNLVVVGFTRAALMLALIIGLFYTARAVMGGRGSRKDLYFALFSFAFSLAYVNIAFNSEAIPPLPLEKMSRIGFSFTPVFLVYFLLEETGILSKNRWLKILLPVPGVVLALLVAFQKELGGVAAVFDLTMNAYLAPLLLFNFVILVIKVIRSNSLEYRALLLGYILVMVTSGHDIVYVLGGNVPYAYLVPYGFFALLLTIFFILATEQTRMFKTTQAQAAELNDSNAVMAEIFGKIDGVSDTLSQSVRKLETVFESGQETIRSFSDSNQGLISEIQERIRGVEDMTGTIETKIQVYVESINESLANQSDSVEAVANSVTDMNRDVSSALDAADATSATARRLAELAVDSIGVMEESRKSIDSVAEYSDFINDVLGSINEISENTNLLSINAAIEAARVGVHGKGFGIVASEVGKLATQSKTTVESSFDRLEQIKTMLKDVIDLSKSVSDSILSIRDGSKQSSDQIDEVRQHVSKHVTEFSKILSLVTTLNRELASIRNTADQQRQNNVEVLDELRFLSGSFADMGSQLAGQLKKGETLERVLGDIGSLISENLESITVLQKLVERNNRQREA
jgi:methyl-accepting chemotaxis protein